MKTSTPQIERLLNALIIVVVLSILLLLGFAWLAWYGTSPNFANVFPTYNPLQPIACFIAFEDQNGNGQRDPEDPRIIDLAGAQVKVEDPEGRYTGQFAFKDCQVGPEMHTHTVTVTFIPPAGYRTTTPASVNLWLQSFAAWPDYPSLSAVVGVQKITPTLQATTSG